jgi:flagellar assembly protein FliH
MSSSAPTRQPASEASPLAFDYAEASGVPGSPGPTVEEHLLEETIRQRETAAFEKGRQTGQQQARSELEAALNKNRTQLIQALREFEVERQNYYRRIEGEVVQLALAIARKILHREVQIDPNCLAGIVRVTLEKIEIGSKVSLHVHPQDAPDWRHYFSCQVETLPAPEVCEDTVIGRGECRIETTMGSTEIGLGSQLKEIETGLLDLLAERPGARTGEPSKLAPSSPSGDVVPVRTPERH